MPLPTLIAAVVVAALGTALGWWPLARWAQRSMLHDRMQLRTIRIIAAASAAVTFVLVLLRFGLVPAALPVLAFAVGGVALSVVDLAEKRLPNPVVALTLAAVGLLLVAATTLTGVWMPLVWALVGAAAMFAFYVLLAIIAPSSVGMGDVKLAVLIGLLLGWLGIGAWLAGLVAAFVVGGIVALIALALRRVTLHGSIPFGPSMLAGALVAALLVGA
jgi:leader peptidase (prepilin peptidase) / N-methyltransferase